MNCNRKDSPPRQTIGKIQSLLCSANVESSLSDIICNDSFAYSVHLSLCGTDIGVNGKGIDEDFAVASAYGEFMERLENGVLVEYWLQKTYDKDNLYGDTDFIKSFLKDNLSEFYQEDIDENTEKLKILLSYKKELSRLEQFYDVQNSQLVDFPVDLITDICGSNGLCAGNSCYEAVNQGICEILERYALREILSRNYSPKRLHRETYISTTSYQIIKAIESHGFCCEILDCTLGGKIPVMAALITNRNKTKYLFSIGADLDFDIAVQRCLTEALQGYKLNLSLEYIMINSLTTESITDSTLSKKNLPYEFNRHIINGLGHLPFEILISNSLTDQANLSVFKNVSDNKGVYEILCEIVSKNIGKLYIQDNSWLGFPAFRIFISNISAIRLSFEKYIEESIIKQIICDAFKSKHCDEKYLLELIQKLNASIYPEREIVLGQLLFCRTEILNISTYFYEIVLLTRQIQFEIAHEKIKLYKSFLKASEYIEILIFTLAKNTLSIEDITNYIEANRSSVFYENYKKFIALCSYNTIFCDNKCFNCEIHKNVGCTHKKLKEIWRTLQPLKNEYKVNLDTYTTNFSTKDFLDEI